MLDIEIKSDIKQHEKATIPTITVARNIPLFNIILFFIELSPLVYS